MLWHSKYYMLHVLFYFTLCFLLFWVVGSVIVLGTQILNPMGTALLRLMYIFRSLGHVALDIALCNWPDWTHMNNHCVVCANYAPHKCTIFKWTDPFVFYLCLGHWGIAVFNAHNLTAYVMLHWTLLCATYPAVAQTLILVVLDSDQHNCISITLSDCARLRLQTISLWVVATKWFVVPTI